MPDIKVGPWFKRCRGSSCLKGFKATVTATQDISSNVYTDGTLTTTDNGDGTYTVAYDEGTTTQGTLPTYVKINSSYITKIVVHRANTLTKADSMFYNCQNATEIIFEPSCGLKPQTAPYMFMYNYNLDTVDLTGVDFSDCTDVSLMFSNCTRLVNLNGFDGSDLGNVTSFNRMFNSVGGFLTNGFSIDLSKWDTSSATNFDYMFTAAKIYTIDATSFDTSNATTMDSMFRSNYINNIDVSGWTNPKVTNMAAMFGGVGTYADATINLTGFKTPTVTNIGRMFQDVRLAHALDLTEFDVSKTTSMGYMFNDFKATSLNMSNWNPVVVTDISNMFLNADIPTLDLTPFSAATGITTAYGVVSGCEATDINLTGIDFSKVTSLGLSFANLGDATTSVKLNLTNVAISSACTSLSETFENSYLTDDSVLNLENWDTSGVTYARRCFQNTTVLELKVSGWDVSKITDMSYMFYGVNIKTGGLDLSSWNTSSVTDLSSIFNGIELLDTDVTKRVIDVSNWVNTKVTTMFAMFYKANINKLICTGFKSTSALTNISSMFGYFVCDSSQDLDLSSMDVSGVTTARTVFQNITVNSINTTGWNTSAMKYIDRMFASITVPNLDLSHWDVSALINISYEELFYRAKISGTLNISNWNAPNITSAKNMFDASDIGTITSTGFNTSAIAYMSYMFQNATNCISFNDSATDTSNVTDMSYMFQGFKGTTLDLTGFDTSSVTTMTSMFNGCETPSIDCSGFSGAALTNADRMFKLITSSSVKLWPGNNDNLTDTSYMFYQATNTNLVIDWNGFDTSKVENMYAMLYNIKATGDIDLSSLSCASCTNMSNLFYLSDISSVKMFGDIDTVKPVANMSYIFYNCTNLTCIDKIDTTNATNTSNMFYACNNLTAPDSTDQNNLLNGASWTNPNACP